MAGNRRNRNSSNTSVTPRQNSVSDSRPRQTLNAEMLATMSKEQLRTECRKRGQKSTGNKNELVFRIFAWFCCVLQCSHA